jgi:hypothetical protein
MARYRGGWAALVRWHSGAAVQRRAGLAIRPPYIRAGTSPKTRPTAPRTPDSPRPCPACSGSQVGSHQRPTLGRTRLCQAFDICASAAIWPQGTTPADSQSQPRSHRGAERCAVARRGLGRSSVCSVPLRKGAVAVLPRASSRAEPAAMRTGPGWANHPIRTPALTLAETHMSADATPVMVQRLLKRPRRGLGRRRWPELRLS